MSTRRYLIRNAEIINQGFRLPADLLPLIQKAIREE